MSNRCTGFLRAVNVHRCTDARISREKSHLVSLSVPSSAASMRAIAIHMSFHHWEIEDDTCAELPLRTAVARVSRKVSLRWRVMFTMVGTGQGGQVRF
jgi:hypothetical protein